MTLPNESTRHVNGSTKSVMRSSCTCRTVLFLSNIKGGYSHEGQVMERDLDYLGFLFSYADLRAHGLYRRRLAMLRRP